MSEKKRKAVAELNGQPSQKRATNAVPNPNITVNYVKSAAVVKPVVASSPGTSLSSKLAFKPYAKCTGDVSELLLHSADHPTIDFTATEAGTYADNHLKHYVAVYDPVLGQLDITEAKSMTVRGTIRQADMAEEDEAPAQATSNYSSRNALTHTFGTKKSKKAVQSRAENVLYSRDTDQNAVNPLSEALLSSMPAAEALPSTADGRILDAAAAIQAAKPLPTPDLNATNVSDAYPLSSLVFPSPFTSTLTAMPTSSWRKTISEGGQVSTSSRFIANRMTYITQAANLHPSPTSPHSTTLQLLRYILLLIELSRAISKYRPTKPLPPISKWPPGRLTDQSQLPTPLLTTLLKKYCPNNNGPTQFDLALLHTTIFALTLHIPPPSGNLVPDMLATDPTDIQQDLNLAAKDARRYFRELGCELKAGTERELSTWGVSPPTGEKGSVKTKYAKLRVPLVFPQVSRGPPSGRRQVG